MVEAQKVRYYSVISVILVFEISAKLQSFKKKSFEVEWKKGRPVKFFSMQC